MFEFIERHKRLLQIILAVLIIPPFALFGVDYYFRGTDPADQVARVAGARITQQEFTQALRQRQEQLRQMMGGKVDQAMLDSPEVRRAVLDQLIDERMLYTAALKSGMTVPAAELQSVIGDIPQFKDGNGKFSPQRYRELLGGQGMSEGMFEASLRKDLIVGRNRDAFSATAFMPASVVDRLYRLRQQKREVSQFVVDPSQFLAGVKATPEEIKAFYESHRQQFELPEKVKVEYVVLSLDAVQKQVAVTPEEVQDYYKARAEQLGKAEERRASHILVALPPGATPEQKAKAKEKAAALLDEAKRAPKDFAELAKKNSEDPGSAAEGGDLGFFARGRMVKPFEDAVFGMKPGEIAGPVETQFGFHILKLTEVKAAEGPKFEAVKSQLEEELRKNKAGRAFAQDADEFSNMIYDQPDSLDPALEKFKLQKQTSGWITRQGGEQPLLNNDKFLSAIFSENAIKRKQNTEAVEVAPNMIVSARVIEHAPSQLRPLEEVQGQIVQVLLQQKAGELAKKEGEALLEKLRKGEDAGVRWSAQQTVTREQRQGMHPEGAQAVFRADASKLPAYVGVDAPGGRFVLYRVSKVMDPETVDAEQLKAFAKQLDPVAGQETLAARVSSLKQRSEVKVDEKKLEKAG
jgi:peptidyl-prolyl cis-trans isomerase D